MVARRDERITRLALGSANRGGRLKSGDEAPQFVETIRVDVIDPDPHQPRSNFDERKLKELAASLTSVGQVQPIVVVKNGDRFIIHVGERRWRASQFAGLATIKALVRTTPLEVQDTIVAQVVENEQRAELTTTELVGAVRKLSSLGMKNAEIARSLAKNPTRISELQALADAPAELLAIADEIGLGLSYQLLRQWRAHPDETRDFVVNVPVEHVSRFTIGTIGQPAPDSLGLPASEPALPPHVAATSPAARDEAGQRQVSGKRLPIREKAAGEGGDDRPLTGTTPAAARDGTVADRKDLYPRSLAAGVTVGAILVEHQEHGLGYLVFDQAVAIDHLAVTFRDHDPIVAHKNEVRILQTFTSGDGPGEMLPPVEGRALDEGREIAAP